MALIMALLRGESTVRQSFCRPLWWLVLFSTITIIGQAERLPLRTYTTADGLANNSINCIRRDSRGFLWFCTREGLSRFDGYSFTNYGREHGLPSATVNDFIETRDGEYWVATAAGLCRFNPRGRAPALMNNAEGAGEKMFTVLQPGTDARSAHVTALYETSAGFVWCGTRAGLYRVERAADGETQIEFADLGIPDHLESRFINCLLEDRRGALWVGATSGLFRRWPDGRIEAFTRGEGLPDVNISSLLEDREGRIWVGTRFGGLFRLVADPRPDETVVARAYTAQDGLPTTWINQIVQVSDGGLWAGSTTGLIQFIPAGDDFRFRTYAEPHGLNYGGVQSLAEDRNGNLWLGITLGGAAKLARAGFTTYGAADNLTWVAGLFERRDGEILVVSRPELGRGISRFDGERFISFYPRFPRSGGGFTWGWNQTVLEDSRGDWWMATSHGVCRFPPVRRPEDLARIAPRRVYTTRQDGLASDIVLRLFEDSRGDVWIGTVGHGLVPNGLSRWERATDTFHHYIESDNLPNPDQFYVSSFAEDRAGNVWIGFSGTGGLARFRDGRFTLFTTADNLPEGQIRNLFVDSRGRLWAATYRGGLCRIDDPTAEHPALVAHTMREGLSSNVTSAVTEDNWNRIYVGTGRGVDRIDLTTNRIKHYTTADGLPLGEVYAALRARNGALWFSFSNGVARLVPEPDLPPVPLPVLITGLRIGGDERPLSALGENEIAPITLTSEDDDLQIEFVALGFSPGEGLHYQYKLEGAGEDWSAPTVQRTINFAHLAPGAYRFLVRAVNADGAVSETPATFSFTIPPPIWRRLWFLVAVALTFALAAYAIYRFRVRRILEVANMRTRIATDLHDDIGANLTRISLLSEVAKQQLGGNGKAESSLSSIARISRESVASMGDIVWAISPDRDTLLDLTRKMRQHAEEIFTRRDIGLRFSTPAADTRLKLGASLRRDVLLIFKEAVNNAARHSNCSHVEIVFRVEGYWLSLAIADDGDGFDSSIETDGNGLVNMRRRAANLGGEFEIVSRPYEGTSIRLRVPVRRASYLQR